MTAPGVLAILELAKDALLGGSGGYFALPAGGRAMVGETTREGVYRVQIDVRIDGPYDRAFAESFNATTFDRVEGLRADGTYA